MSSAAMGRAPKRVDTVDITTLDLTAQEGFLVSRIDGSTSAELLADLVGMSGDQVQTTLRKLEHLGAIHWEGADAPKVESPPPSKQPAAPEPAGAAGTEDGIDLSRDVQLRIIRAEKDLENGTYWDLLGLYGNPSAADIKRAYFDATKIFHPDRYFGKDLGSFKPRMQKVFQGVRTAYETLGDPNKAAQYKTKHPPSRRKQPEAPKTKAEARQQERDLEKERRLEEHRKKLLERRRQSKMAPMQNQAKRAQDMFDEGMRLMREKDLQGATRSLGLAVAWAPNNEAYKQQYDEVSAAAHASKCKDLVDAADLEIASAQHANAGRLLGEASELMPSNAGYACRAAEQWIRAADYSSAEPYVLRAIENGPRRKDCRLVAAAFYEAKSDFKTALSHVEIAASLDKNDAHVKKMLKKLSKKAG